MLLGFTSNTCLEIDLRTFVAGQGSRRGATGRWNEKWARVVEGQMAFYGSEMDKTNDMPQVRSRLSPKLGGIWRLFLAEIARHLFSGTRLRFQKAESRLQNRP